MELISQRTKKIMEECKDRARAAGLRFQNESLEYIVTNRDLIELTPKYMIPTMYDYWVHDVEVLREKGRYELYPSNPYETVINTRPAISFYNDNNPDWMNVMIFYHVLGHIDFFQNNTNFRLTWDDDFAGKALADKRLIARLRSEKGRWVDYVIEFSRGLDNLVAFHRELSRSDPLPSSTESDAIDYYFDVFLQTVKSVSMPEYLKELDRYNGCLRHNPDHHRQMFLSEVNSRYPEFEALLRKHSASRIPPCLDLIQFLMKNSEFLNRSENAWMKQIMEVVRSTSMVFQPQIRTKIMNEGWASYWHELLFLADDRIRGHEVDFARTHAGVTSMPRVGLNPYALGMRLFQYIETLGDKGRYSMTYRRTRGITEREHFDAKAQCGRDMMYDVRSRLSDQLFIETFIDQDFVDKHDLFVTGRRLNRDRMVWEYYVKSRDAEQFRAMVRDHLYHPPSIEIAREPVKDAALSLVHRFEGKPLVRDFIANTLLGLEYLWGGAVTLETSEAIVDAAATESASDEPAVTWRRVRYTMRDRKLSKRDLA